MMNKIIIFIAATFILGVNSPSLAMQTVRNLPAQNKRPLNNKMVFATIAQEEALRIKNPKLLEHSSFKGKSLLFQNKFFPNFAKIPARDEAMFDCVTRPLSDDEKKMAKSSHTFDYHKQHRVKAVELHRDFERECNETVKLHNRGIVAAYNKEDHARVGVLLDAREIDMERRAETFYAMNQSLNENNYMLMFHIYDSYKKNV
jgi:hypothetical protein